MSDEEVTMMVRAEVATYIGNLVLNNIELSVRLKAKEDVGAPSKPAE